MPHSSSAAGPIRTGIIGFGLAGRVFHAPFIATNPDFVLEVIATSNTERAAEATAQHPGVEIVATAEELIARELDLVILASPPHVHLEQALAAFAVGSNVVIDKPFAASVADAKQIIAKAEGSGKMLAVFQNRRWDGDFRTVQQLIADGALGTVFRFESTFERWGTPKVGQWQEAITASQGGGILFDLGSHLVDQALHLFGPAHVETAELRAVRGGVSEDDAFLSLIHESGVHSHLTMSRVAAQSGPRFRVLGDASGYSVHGLDNQEPALKEQRWPGSGGYGITPEAEWGLLGIDGSLQPVPTLDGQYPEFYAGVAASILTGAPSPVDPRESLEVVRIIERAHAMSSSAG
jgi:predicted dehydrogenase